VAKDKAGNDLPTPENEAKHAVPTIGHRLPLFKLFRRKKKTTNDQSGWELMGVTRAMDEKDAFDIARTQYEAEYGIPVKVEPVAQ